MLVYHHSLYNISLTDNLKFIDMLLFQLKISINTECTDLKLGTGLDTREDLKMWGLCRSGLKGISNESICSAYAYRISAIHKLVKSIFGANLHRALRSCLGDVKCFQSDPLSLTGYCFDFEILLDRRGNPIHIPMKWKFKSQVLLKASIGVKEDIKIIKNHRQTKAMILDNVIGFMKESEEDITNSENFDVNLSKLCLNRRMKQMNISNDWGYRFGNYPQNVARKIVIEANGPFHYACNCNHSMGYTVLKERHIRNMGWELISVSL